jgi:thiol-disulfide isomerase/thioredoxin
MSLLRRLAPETLSAHGLPNLGDAPELLGVQPWFNTPDGGPLTLAHESGRIVLIEFWTFACSNCVRTLPFLKRMHSRHRRGLTVVGVHTPELPFERPPRNVARAVRDRGLSFPVGVDNDYAAWDAYGNRYWPSLYLVDGAGRIRYVHVGEGRYHATEKAIRALLDESPGSDPHGEVDAPVRTPRTNE